MMPSRWFVLIVMILLFLVVRRDLAGQVAGVSGAEPISAYVVADVFRERIGSDSAVYLIVLWRGREFWNRSPIAGEGSRGGVSGIPPIHFTYREHSGGIGRRIDFDRAAQQVIIDLRDTLRTRADSTLVVMVDRIDSVGGPPTVTSVKVARLPAVVIYTPPPPRDEYLRMAQEFLATGKVDNKLTQFLATIPSVRDFLNRRPASP